MLVDMKNENMKNSVLVYYEKNFDHKDPLKVLGNSRIL